MESAYEVPLACNKSKCTVTLSKSGVAAISLANTRHFERSLRAKLFPLADYLSYIVPVADESTVFKLVDRVSLSYLSCASG